MDSIYNIVRASCLELAELVAQNLRDELQKPKKKWCRNWISKKEDGISQNLVPKLKKDDPKGFKKFLRMSPRTFCEVLLTVKAGISKHDTNMREAIPASTKLEIVLHYLATGSTFSSTEYYFRVSNSCISSFLPEVLQEICDKLGPEYLKVCFEDALNTCFHNFF